MQSVHNRCAGGLKTYPRNSQNIIWIVDLRGRSGRNKDQIYHPSHHNVSKNNGNNALDSALLAQAFALLCLDEVGMLWFEV